MHLIPFKNVPYYQILDRIFTAFIGGTQTGINLERSTTDELDVEVLVDDDGIEINGSNQLQLKDDGVTKEKINADVAGTGLAQDTDGSLKLDSELTGGGSDNIDGGGSNNVPVSILSGGTSSSTLIVSLDGGNSESQTEQNIEGGTANEQYVYI